jgi:hypothetical protein
LLNESKRLISLTAGTPIPRFNDEASLKEAFVKLRKRSNLFALYVAAIVLAESSTLLAQLSSRSNPAYGKRM